MPKKSSSPPFSKNAGLFPAILLLLLLHAGAEEAAPWHFLPTFVHDVRRVQGFADGYFVTAGTTRRRDAAATSGGMRSRLENMMLHFFLEKTRNPV